MSSELSGLLWRKSSYSNGQANCVEVASMSDYHTIVAVRDSKAPGISKLTFTAPTWRQFTRSVKFGTPHRQDALDKSLVSPYWEYQVALKDEIYAIT